jgi:hypothetical protein
MSEAFFDKLLKLNYIKSKTQILDVVYYYWDIRHDTIRFIGDVIREYNDNHILENLIQHDLLVFFALDTKNYESMRLLNILYKREEMPPRFLKSDHEIPEQMKTIERQIPYTNISTTILNTPNIGVTELLSEVYILTKEMCWPLIYSEINDLPENIKITYMRYRDNWRFSTSRKYFAEKRDSEMDILQIEFEINSNLACMSLSRNYLTVLKFTSSLSSLTLQSFIINIFNRFQIIAITKRNIKIKYTPRPSVNKSLIIPLRDVMMTGELSKYMITTETDRPLEKKKRGSFMFAGKKVSLSMTETNEEIHFKISEKLVSYPEVLYFGYAITMFLKEFHQNKDFIIAQYQKNIKSLTIIDIKKVKKTKKLIDNLREAEPTIFADIYTQDCQYQRQPYILDTKEEFTNILKELFGDDKGLQSFLDKRSQELARKVEIDDLILEFPTGEYETYYPLATKRYYACVGRKGLDSEKFPFPLVQKKSETESTYNRFWSKDLEQFLKIREVLNEKVRGAPCCFHKLHDETRMPATTTHVLTSMKNVPPERKGVLQNYLSSFLGNDFYRYGMASFEDIITRPKTPFQIDPQNERFSTYKLTEESLHFWSFTLGVNMVVFELIDKYNSLILKVVPLSIDSNIDKFILFTKNSSGTYEVVKTSETTIHSGGILSEYLKHIYKIQEEEKLKRT